MQTTSVERCSVHPLVTSLGARRASRAFMLVCASGDSAGLQLFLEATDGRSVASMAIATTPRRQVQLPGPAWIQAWPGTAAWPERSPGPDRAQRCPRAPEFGPGE